MKPPRRRLRWAAIGTQECRIAGPRRDNPYRLSAQLPARVFTTVLPRWLFRPKRQAICSRIFPVVIDIHRARHPPAVCRVLVVGLGVLHGDLINPPARSTTPAPQVPDAIDRALAAARHLKSLTSRSGRK